MGDIVLRVRTWAEELGASHIQPLGNREHLRAKQTVRDACLVNSCGRSGRCWTCPPHIGELAQLEVALLSFDTAIIIQSIAQIEDSWDFEGMQETGERHNNMMRELRRRLRIRLAEEDILVLGCGGCGYCERCVCPNEECKHPLEALASVEGYGIDVKELVESVGLSYINGVNTVSYVGTVLINCQK